MEDNGEDYGKGDGKVRGGVYHNHGVGTVINNTNCGNISVNRGTLALSNEQPKSAYVAAATNKPVVSIIHTVPIIPSGLIPPKKKGKQELSDDHLKWWSNFFWVVNPNHMKVST